MRLSSALPGTDVLFDIADAPSKVKYDLWGQPVQDPIAPPNGTSGTPTTSKDGAEAEAAGSGGAAPEDAAGGGGGDGAEAQPAGVGSDGPAASEAATATPGAGADQYTPGEEDWGFGPVSAPKPQRWLRQKSLAAVADPAEAEAINALLHPIAKDAQAADLKVLPDRRASTALVPPP